MANRPGQLRQTDATRYLKAARNAGYSRARVITHPDGRIEIVAENGEEAKPAPELSPFEKWQAGNAR